MLVLEDADLEQAVNLAAWGSFFHQSQICMTTGWHVVHARLYDDFVEALAEKADHLPVGNPATEQVALGLVIDEGQRDRIHGLEHRSGRQGRGGGVVRRVALPAHRAVRGDPAHPAFAEELFGPVAPVLLPGWAPS